MLRFQNAVDQAGDAQRENRIHVIPQFPIAQHLSGAAVPGAEAIAKAIEKRVEVVVLDDEHARGRMFVVVVARWSAICSRIAVLPAPFSPNTIDVAGSAGLP